MICTNYFQSVLIHSAAGGVGLAAIQLSQLLGAEVYRPFQCITRD